jgi:hypothetical protein
MQAQLRALAEQAEQYTKTTLRPLLAQLRGLEESFWRQYAEFLKLRQQADRLRQLGG